MANNKYHSEIVKDIAKQTGKPMTQVSEIIDAFLCGISDTLNENTIVTIRDFGSFRLSQRSERTSHNPITGEKMTIPAKEVVTFKPAKKIRAYSQIYKK